MTPLRVSIVAAIASIVLIAVILELIRSGRLRERYAFAVALIRVRTAQALDDLVEMFLRRVQKLHQQAKEALADYREQHQEQTDALVTLLGHIVSGWQASETPEQQRQAVDAMIGGRIDTILAQCEAHLEYAGNNYLPFLRSLFRPHRKLFLDVLEFLHPTSPSADTALEQAITFVSHHRRTRAIRLPVREEHDTTTERLPLSWIPQRWSLSGRNGGRVDREVSHPGPSQIRTCPTRASGSSNLQIRYVPTVVCTIFTRGSG